MKKMKTQTKTKTKRTNWSSGEGLKRMTEAVDDWVAKETRDGECLGGLSLRQYAARVGIPLATLAKHVPNSKGEVRTRLGAAHGTAPLLQDHLAKLVAEAVVVHDRANEGMEPAECIKMVQDLEPRLSWKQATDKWHRIHEAFKRIGKLTGKCLAQKTTTKRTAITLQGQWM